MEMEMAMKAVYLGLKKNNSKLKSSFSLNRKGQLAIEAVLLMTVLLSVFLVLTNELSKRKIIQNLVSKPIESVGRMAGYGTWQAQCVGQGKSKKLNLGQCHPNSIQRSLSTNPE